MSWIITLYFTELELQASNRYLSFYSSIIVFWLMVKPIDRLSIDFALFRLEKFPPWPSGCFTPSAEIRRPCSIFVHTCAHKFNCTLNIVNWNWSFALLIFVHSNNSVHYFKSFSRLKPTKNEKLPFILGLKITRVIFIISF